MDEIRELVKEVSKCAFESNQSQTTFVIQECAELIKECTDCVRYRSRGRDYLVEEACDVLAATFVLLDYFKVPEEEVKERIIFKHKRALERYYKTGKF